MDGFVNVNALVNGVIEDDGTCTLTMTKGTKSVHVTRPSEANASNTTCGRMSISRGSLSSGTWSTTVSYLSPTAKGASEAMSIEVK
jgi:hypothetical protein